MSVSSQLDLITWHRNLSLLTGGGKPLLWPGVLRREEVRAMSTHVMQLVIGGAAAYFASGRSVRIWADRSSGSVVVWLGRPRRPRQP